MVLKIFTDGGSRGNPGAAAIGVVVLEGDQELHTHHEFIGIKTNNEAEYTAFLYSLTWLKNFLHDHQVERVEWYLDSMLVVEQLQKHWKIKEPRIQQFAAQIWQLLVEVSTPHTIKHVPRAQNARADQLVNQALDTPR